MNAAERFAAWLVTGPLGRVAAFFGDLAAYWWRWARDRIAQWGGRQARH